MKKKRNHPLADYWLEASAVTLVLILAVALGGQLGNRAPITVEANGGVVSAVLSDNQTLAIEQLPKQRVAQFVLSSSLADSVSIESITFRAAGNLTTRISRQSNIAPLNIYLDAQPIGIGSGWMYNYGSFEQAIPLSEPILLTNSHPAILDVYADLTKLRDYTFGVELAKVDGSSGESELSALGQIYKVKAFL